MRHVFVVSSFFVVLASVVETAPRPFRAVDLGTLGGSFSYAAAVSNDGKVVGASQVASGDEHAFVWTKESGMVDLGTLGGSSSYAAHVSDNGKWVVGASTTADGASHAFVWTETTGMVDISEGRANAWVRGVNNRGMVIGVWTALDDPAYYGFVWTPSRAVIDLGSYTDPISLNNRGLVALNRYAGTVDERAFAWSVSGGMFDLDPFHTSDITEASAVNDSGVIVGGTMTCDPRPCDPAGSNPAVVHAFGWTAESGIVDLDNGGSGSTTVALGVADDGLIAGRLVIPQSPSHVFARVRSGRLVDIGTLGGLGTELYHVNDGTIVGISQVEGEQGLGHAFAWTREEGMTDLGAYGEVSVATQINKKGVIVGEACDLTIRPTVCHATMWVRSNRVRGQ